MCTSSVTQLGDNYLLINLINFPKRVLMEKVHCLNIEVYSLVYAQILITYPFVEVE